MMNPDCYRMICAVHFGYNCSGRTTHCVLFNDLLTANFHFNEDEFSLITRSHKFC